MINGTGSNDSTGISVSNLAKYRTKIISNFFQKATISIIWFKSIWLAKNNVLDRLLGFDFFLDFHLSNITPC